MRKGRLILVSVLLLAVLGAAALLLLPRLRSPRQASSSAVPQATSTRASRTKRSAKTPMPTSEDLIAAALKANEITYEESLLQRAYAIFDDPRQRKEFRSQVINWEAGSALLNEIQVKESTLSKGLLQALAPFRVRPNDPSSIVNRPRAEVMKAADAPAGWVTFEVPGTDVRLWKKGGTEEELRQRYAPMVQQIWGVFEKFFPLPGPDDGTKAQKFNIDQLIDFYLIPGNDIDPRNAVCGQNRNAHNCTFQGKAGLSPSAAPIRGRQASGYCLINAGLDDDWLRATFAHELAHVTQHGFDKDEDLLVGIGEGTASWVEYKVQKELGIEPNVTYDLLDPMTDTTPLFDQLDRSLHTVANAYGSWLFYYSLSRRLGDDVVTRIWEKAGAVGFQGIKAVDEIARLDDYFPPFTVLNWNKDSVQMKYRETDRTFRQGLEPGETIGFPSGPGTYALDEAVAPLSARYYYSSWGSDIRRISLRNFYADVPEAHIWAIKKTPMGWDVPEDWSRDRLKTLCRDIPKQDVSELVLILSNTSVDKDLPNGHPPPELILENVGCETVEGTAQSSLHINKPDQHTDMTYVSSIAVLKFKPRTIQDPEKGKPVQNPFTGQMTTYPGTGNVEYDLMPTSVVWTVSGIKDGCKVDGKMLVDIPDLLDLPLDPTRPSYGYLNVVSKDGGDFHSLKVMTFDSSARMRKFCPNSDKPQLEPFESAILLSVLSEPNTHTGNAVSFRGQQTFDPDRFEDQLPAAARELLKNMPQVQQAFRNRPAGGRLVYSFNWELRPRPAP